MLSSVTSSPSTEWLDLPSEVHLNILSFLIHSEKFPHALFNFSTLSKYSLNLARDSHIWREAIRFYFPFVEAALHEQFIENPLDENPFHRQFYEDAFSLFFTCYKISKTILLSEKIDFLTYAKAVSAGAGIAQGKKTILARFLFAFGHKRKFDPTDIPPGTENYALPFFVALRLNSKVSELLQPQLPPIHIYLVRLALLEATEGGNLSLVNLLIAKMPFALDDLTIREALIIACRRGHKSIVDVFFSHYTQQALRFALPMALKAACRNNHVEIVFELLSKKSLQDNPTALTEGITIAFKNGYHVLVCTILKNASLANDAPFLLDFFNRAFAQGDNAVVSIILTEAKTPLPATTLFDATMASLKKNNETMGLTLLKHQVASLRLYQKHQIFYKAAAQGCVSITQFLFEHQADLLDQTQIGEVLKSAALANQPIMLKWLIENMGAQILAADKKAIIHTACFKQTGISIEELMGSHIEEEITHLITQIEDLQLNIPPLEALPPPLSHLPQYNRSHRVQTLISQFEQKTSQQPSLATSSASRLSLRR